MLLKMIRGVLFHQRGKMLLIAFTIALGASLATGMLNDMLNDAVTRVQPPSDKGRRLKIFYMTQVSVKPPKFVIFCNSAELFHFSYQRYIENCLRETFGFKGTPIQFVIRERERES